MAGIVFYFEENDVDVWSGRPIDLDAWNYNCKLANIDKAIIVNKTDTVIGTFDNSIDVTIVTAFTWDMITGTTTEVVCPEETPNITLWDFDHQTDWYLFGPANGWNHEYHADNKITIPQSGNAHHHSIFICTTVMFHRYNVLGDVDYITDGVKKLF